MLTRKGFTLVELMVVILIVAILAAVAIPIMRGRLDAAKWTEGKAMAGTIATSIRAYCAEKNPDNLTGANKDILTWTELGLKDTDFDGTYFDNSLFNWSVDYDKATEELNFTVTVNKPITISSPDAWTLHNDTVVGKGVWEPAGGPGL